MGHIFFSRLGPLFQLKIYQELIVRKIPFTKWHDDYQSRCYTFYKNGDILLNNGSFLEPYMLQCVKQNSASIAQYIIMYWSYLLRIFPVMKKKKHHCTVCHQLSTWPKEFVWTKEFALCRNILSHGVLIHLVDFFGFDFLSSVLQVLHFASLQEPEPGKKKCTNKFQVPGA